VHGGIKTDKILVELDIGDRKLMSVKLIDLGQSYLFSEINQLLAIKAPEYLPPEILENANYKTSKQKIDFNTKVHLWSIDIWSFGMVLIEISLGIPLWFSNNGYIICE